MKIILATMVKNESKIIERMLDSAKNIIDGIVLMDTGSTDYTKDKAVLWAILNDIPIRVIDYPFQSFAHNRTLLVSEASRIFNPNPDTWLLLLDADHVINGSLDGVELSDCNSIWQSSKHSTYTIPRLLRSTVPAKYKGRTHEFMSVEGYSKGTINRSRLWIDDFEDGGSKADKFERDERLLLLDIADDPSSSRSWYYLGNTYKALKKYNQAISAYDKRIALNGWEEERWHAAYSIGLCLIETEAGLDAVSIAMGRAYAMRPWRAEPLAALAMYCMNRNNDKGREAALSIARTALNIEYPSKDILFIENDVYKWTFRHIISICSFYFEDGRGMEFCDYLRLASGSPHRDNALSNSRWYVKKIEAKTISIPINFPLEKGWYACNPSIIRCSDGYRACVRTVNYFIDDRGRYTGYGEAIKNRSFLVKLSCDFHATGEAVELKSPDGDQESVVLGLEDIRLVCRYGVKSDEIHALANRSDWGELTFNGRSMPRMEFVSWDYSGNILESKPLVLSPGKCEKNWLPYSTGGGEILNAVYGHHPFTTLRIEDGLHQTVGTIDSFDLSGFKGSASPISWGSGWLYMIHETIPGDQPIYLHRFCWMDSHGELVRASRLFYMEKIGIEFCCGLCHTNNGVAITYGVMDREAKISLVDTSTVDSMLNNGVCFSKPPKSACH